MWVRLRDGIITGNNPIAYMMMLQTAENDETDKKKMCNFLRHNEQMML